MRLETPQGALFATEEAQVTPSGKRAPERKATVRILLFGPSAELIFGQSLHHTGAHKVKRLCGKLS
ncbi:hypothetical protein NCCP2716_19440 [Sporosarcina sp. NCCP-2716]|nr:hypothetical protein NCCP2716_19440 [Sporosarcina sp. NCCP-2716]